MAEEKGNNVGLTEKDYQPLVDGKEEFYGNLLKFPACRELENCSEKEIREVRLSSIDTDINCTKLIDKIPLLRMVSGSSMKSRRKSVLFSKTYFYLTSFDYDEINEIGIIDRDIGMDRTFARSNGEVPFYYNGDDFNPFYGLCSGKGLFPIFVNNNGIRIEKKKILTSPQLMAVFELLINEIPEALSIITVKDSFEIDSNDTQLTDTESEILEAQKNLIDSLKKSETQNKKIKNGQ